LARRYGWTRRVPDASVLFAPTDQPTSPELIVQDLRPAPPELDFSLWPSILATRAHEIGESVGCDPVVPLFAGLSAICGVVDARIRLELMPGYRVPPVLWLMTVGDPSDKKSPGSRPMLSPLKGLEMDDIPRFKQSMVDWEVREAVYNSAHKSMLDSVTKAEFMLGGELPPLPEKPEMPVSAMITVGDITSQKLIRLAADRPRGILCHLDEMNSWVRKVCDKSSGEDRSAWVQSYESESYKMDRVGAGPIHAENLAVSIYGNIQPRVFRENIKQLAEDGLIQRFIPAALHHDKTKRGRPVPDYLTHKDKWENTLRLVYSMPPTVYKLSPEAHRLFGEFQDWYETAKKKFRITGADHVFQTAFGKLEGTTGRFALLFHMAENPFNPTIDADLMGRVITLIRTYIVPSLQYAFGELAGRSTFDIWVMDYLLQFCDSEAITLSTIKTSARVPLKDVNTYVANQLILAAMGPLEKAGWVHRIDDGANEHRGIAEWIINPYLKDTFKTYRQSVVEAKQWLADIHRTESGYPVRAMVHGHQKEKV
ncbi:MAG: DUF3987 domain-containing protein, partial [Sulfobacillus sp.]